MKVIVLGCGPSSSVPSISCLLKPEGGCSVCREAYANPMTSKNNRGNPSILMQVENKSIIIDCGKTFRTAVLKCFPVHQISHVNDVILTHDHADACLGLDDLRDVQEWKIGHHPDTGEKMRYADSPITVYCDDRTRRHLAQRFDYLVSKSTDEEKQRRAQERTYRWTAELEWQTIKKFQPVHLHGLVITPIPVAHGDDYIAFGFDIRTPHGSRLVYLSDISELSSPTEEYFKEHTDPIHVLMIDALTWSRFHGTHMNFEQALDVMKRLRPHKTYLTGMSCQWDYATTSIDLEKYQQSLNLDIAMSFDGMTFTLE